MDNALLKKEIRFRCRRGLKETDMLFARFIEAELEKLDGDELLELKCLLANTDQDLLAWFFDGTLPQDKRTPLTDKVAFYVSRRP